MKHLIEQQNRILVILIGNQEELNKQDEISLILFVNKYGNMKKLFIILLCITPFSCMSVNNNLLPSMNSQAVSGYWKTKPSDNKIIIIGISSPMLKKEEQINFAKEDAARKVAMFYGIDGYIETTQTTGGNFFNHVYDNKINLIYDNDFYKYIDNLTYDPQNDVILTNDSVFVRFQYETNAGRLKKFSVNIVNGRPDWSRGVNIPQFDGFITAVGVAQNQRWLKDTIFKSAENAAVQIIEYISTTVYTKEIDSSEQGFIGYTFSNSEGSLYGFQVIEFWIDAETNYVYSLAIARKK